MATATAAMVAAAVAAAVLILLGAAAAMFAQALVLFDALVVVVDPQMGICVLLSLNISTWEGIGLQ